jgi:hypothetical protein
MDTFSFNVSTSTPELFLWLDIISAAFERALHWVAQPAYLAYQSIDLTVSLGMIIQRHFLGVFCIVLYRLIWLPFGRIVHLLLQHIWQ